MSPSHPQESSKGVCVLVFGVVRDQDETGAEVEFVSLPAGEVETVAVPHGVTLPLDTTRSDLRELYNDLLSGWFYRDYDRSTAQLGKLRALLARLGDAS